MWDQVGTFIQKRARTLSLAAIFSVIVNCYQCQANKMEIVQRRQEMILKCNEATQNWKDSTDQLQCANTVSTLRRACPYEEMKAWIDATDDKCNKLKEKNVPSCLDIINRINVVTNPESCADILTLLRTSCPYEQAKKPFEKALGMCNQLVKQSRTADNVPVNPVPPVAGRNGPRPTARNAAARRPELVAVPAGGHGLENSTDGQNQEALLKASEQLERLTADLPRKAWY